MKRCSRQAFLVAALACVAVRAGAADRLWDNDSGDNLWSTAQNWDGDVPIGAVDEVLVFPASQSGLITNDVAAYDLKSLTFSSDYTVAGSEQIRFDNNDSIDVSGNGTAVEIGCSTYFANTVTENVAGGCLLIFNGVVAGNSQPQVHIGGGTYRYTNPANTHSRQLSISSGTIEFTSIGALGAEPRDVKLGEWNSQYSSPRILSYIGTNDMTGSLNLRFGGAADGASLTVANDSPNNSNMTLSGDLLFTDGLDGGTVYCRFTGSSTGTTTMAGTITDHVTAIPAKTGIKLNSSGALRLQATNTYTGPTIIDAGTLLVNGPTVGNGEYTVNSGGCLAGTGTVSGATTVMAGGRLSPGDNWAGSLTFNNALDITALATNNSGDLLFDLGESSDRIVLSPGADLSVGAGTLGMSDFTFSSSEPATLFETDQDLTGILDPADRSRNGLTLYLTDGRTDIVLAPPVFVILVR